MRTIWRNVRRFVTPNTPGIYRLISRPRHDSGHIFISLDPRRSTPEISSNKSIRFGLDYVLSRSYSELCRLSQEQCKCDQSGCFAFVSLHECAERNTIDIISCDLSSCMQFVNKQNCNKVLK